MKIVKSLAEIEGNDFFLTIGNFDGVHKGHQFLLKEILRASKASSAKLAVITFIPHPIQILSPKENFLINSYEERRELLKSVGIDYLCEIDFNRDLSTKSPETFLSEYVLTSKRLKRIYLGHDFAFGANKSGDFSFVREFCKNLNIEVLLSDEYKEGNSNISSTAIRVSIINGQIQEANDYLGRDFYISGLVVKGDQRGKKIGFPTANLQFPTTRLMPKKGVYITKTYLGDQQLNSVTNIGINPTFEIGDKVHIETHILDFNKNIYGQEMRVFFLKRLRDEIKFSSVESLISQIKTDIKIAKEYFKI